MGVAHRLRLQVDGGLGKRAEDTSEDARHACAARAAGGHGAWCGVPSLATRRCQHKGGRRQPSMEGWAGGQLRGRAWAGVQLVFCRLLASVSGMPPVVRLLGLWRCLPARGGLYALIWICKLRAVCARAIPECAHAHTTRTQYVSAHAGRQSHTAHIQRATHTHIDQCIHCHNAPHP